MIDDSFLYLVFAKLSLCNRTSLLILSRDQIGAGICRLRPPRKRLNDGHSEYVGTPENTSCPCGRYTGLLSRFPVALPLHDRGRKGYLLRTSPEVRTQAGFDSRPFTAGLFHDAVYMAPHKTVCAGQTGKDMDNPGKTVSHDISIIV